MSGGDTHAHSEMCIRWDQSGYVCPQLEAEARQLDDPSGHVSVSRAVLEQAIHDYELEWGYSPNEDAWPNVLRVLLGKPSGVDLNNRDQVKS